MPPRPGKHCVARTIDIDSSVMDLNKKAARTGVCGVCIGLVLAIGPGCDDKRRHKASDPVRVVSVEAPVSPDALPGEVARAFFETLVEAQKARERGLGRPENRAAYDRAMGKLRSLCDARAVHSTLANSGSPTVPFNVTRETALTLVTESWVSMVAHYVDGFLYKTLLVTPSHPETSATVYLEAERPEDRARLAAIEASAPAVGAKDANGNPIVKGSRAYEAWVQSEALKLGFNTPIRVRMSVNLQRVEGAWRVSRLSIGPVPRPRPGPATAGHWEKDHLAFPGCRLSPTSGRLYRYPV